MSSQPQHHNYDGGGGGGGGGGGLNDFKFGILLVIFPSDSVAGMAVKGLNRAILCF